MELDVTPPPSPKAGDDSEKRRSGRHTQRKKYVDEIDLNLSEDENLLMNLPPDVAMANVNAAAAGLDTQVPKETESGFATPKEPSGPASVASEAKPLNTEDTTNDSVSGPNYAYVVSDTKKIAFFPCLLM